MGSRAALGRRRLLEPGVVLVATIRGDGTPRLSPVEPLVMDGNLWLSMLWQSRKAADLLRDPRILVHRVITGRDGGEGEFKVRGVASAERDLVVQRRYADEVAGSLGWSPDPGRFHLFALSIGEVTFIRYDDATGDPARGHVAARLRVRPPAFAYQVPAGQPGDHAAAVLASHRDGPAEREKHDPRTDGILAGAHGGPMASGHGRDQVACVVASDSMPIILPGPGTGLAGAPAAAPTAPRSRKCRASALASARGPR